MAIRFPDLRSLTDEWVGIAAVAVGQLLGFFRCLAEGLRPDEPGMGTISRVVSKFTLHGAGNPR